MARQRYKSGRKKGKFMSNRAIAAQRAARKGKRKTRKTKRRAAPRKGKRKVARKKRRRRSRGRGYMNVTEKGKIGLAGVGLGWIETQGYMDQVPVLRDQGTGTKAYGMIAIASHVLAKKLKSRWLDRLGVAATGVAGYKFGAAGFSIQGDEGGTGWDEAMDADEADEVSGNLDI